MSDRVLVTGAEGFVGGHLVAELGDGAAPADVDVTEPDLLARAVRAERPYAVVHLAGLSSVGDTSQGAADVWRVNVLGTVNVLEAVRAEQPDARVLVVSSGDVYGATPGGPVDEAHPIAPVSHYAASKAAAENACARSARADGIDVVVARSFPHTGPGQDERFAVGSWAHQVARLEASGGGDLSVGDLSVERDFTDVRDVCRAYRMMLEPAVPAGTYNVASGTTVSLADIVDLLISSARCPISVERDPGRLRRADVRVLCGSPARLAAATGWEPEIPLETTVLDALEAARQVVLQERAAT